MEPNTARICFNIQWHLLIQKWGKFNETKLIQPTVSIWYTITGQRLFFDNVPFYGLGLSCTRFWQRLVGVKLLTYWILQSVFIHCYMVFLSTEIFFSNNRLDKLPQTSFISDLHIKLRLMKKSWPIVWYSTADIDKLWCDWRRVAWRCYILMVKVDVCEIWRSQMWLSNATDKQTNNVPSIATNMPCGVWHWGQTTCILDVGPLFGLWF